jgi:hypothetical protein
MCAPTMTNELRADLPPLPDRMRGLPLDHRGFPVPWFVAITDGVPDFRVLRPGGLQIAVKKNICWICGGPLGVYMAFVIGPMCAINRINSEPPSHRQCAEFAVRACPFMLHPRMKRNEKDLPELHLKPAGVHLDRNPGVMCMWITKSFKPFKVHNGYLLDLGEPCFVTWWTEGRAATRAEVQASIAGGFPQLQAMAEQEGPDSVAGLSRKVAAVHRLLPQEENHVAD